MLLLSCGLFLHGQWPAKAMARVMAYFAAIGVAMMGLMVWAQWLGGFELPIEGWLASTTDRVENIPVGRMSPLTAAALLFAALALVLELPPLGHRRPCRQIGSVLALTVSSISLVVALSYAAGMPVLYGTHTIPMALWTAISFVPLAVGLLAAAGGDVLPFSLFQSGPNRLRRTPRWVLATMIGWTGLLLGLGVWYHAGQCTNYLEMARNYARATHEKDLIYRRWNASHGGVYVPVTEKNPPNPFLAAKEREVTTPSGRVLTLVNPAYMTRQVHELAANQGPIRSRIVSLHP